MELTKEEREFIRDRRLKLPPQRKAVLVGIALGKSIKELAGDQSEKSIEYHWRMLRYQFGFTCYQEATMFALARRLIRNKFLRGLVGAALVTSCPTAFGQVPMPPKALVATNYYAVTATVGVLESDYSAAVAFTNLPTLAWDYTNAATFTVYSSRTGRDWKAIGTTTNRSFTVVPATNAAAVVTVRALVATNASGPWVAVTNWPAISVTNPVGNVFYKLEVVR
jgi:hypothetical protein